MTREGLSGGVAHVDGAGPARLVHAQHEAHLPPVTGTFFVVVAAAAAAVAAAAVAVVVVI